MNKLIAALEASDIILIAKVLGDFCFYLQRSFTKKVARISTTSFVDFVSAIDLWTTLLLALSFQYLAVQIVSKTLEILAILFSLFHYTQGVVIIRFEFGSVIKRNLLSSLLVAKRRYIKFYISVLRTYLHFTLQWCRRYGNTGYPCMLIQNILFASIKSLFLLYTVTILSLMIFYFIPPMSIHLSIIFLCRLSFY